MPRVTGGRVQVRPIQILYTKTYGLREQNWLLSAIPTPVHTDVHNESHHDTTARVVCEEELPCACAREIPNARPSLLPFDFGVVPEQSLNVPRDSPRWRP